MRTVDIYKVPSESLWRAFELAKLKELTRDLSLKGHILEIGCGNGEFSSLIFNSIDDGIDINPRAIERCKRSTNVYKRVHCMDVRSMKFSENSYDVVFANCVIEHIFDLDEALRSSYRVLTYDGKFVATVPLREMNSHLLLQTNWYAEMRRKQLQHENLFTVEGWQDAFQRAGFSEVKIYPYLLAKDCFYWDLLDFPICIGYGRYTVSSALRLIGKALPPIVRRNVRRNIVHLLNALVSRPGNNSPCAIAIVAYKH